MNMVIKDVVTNGMIADRKTIGMNGPTTTSPSPRKHTISIV